MAWFDYLNTMGQALGQGAQLLQRQQQLRAENARQQRQLAIQEAADQRAREEADQRTFDQLLGMTEPGNELPPDLLAELAQPRFAKYAKASVVKTPEGKFTRRMTEAQRRAQMETRSSELQLAALEQQNEARTRVRKMGRAIYDLPMEDRRMLAMEGGYDPDKFLTTKEQVSIARQMGQVSPSVLSAGIMAQAAQARTGAAMSPTEAFKLAADDWVAEARINEVLRVQAANNPQVREMWIQQQAQKYLSAAGAASAAPAGMPQGYELISGS